MANPYEGYDDTKWQQQYNTWRDTGMNDQQIAQTVKDQSGVSFDAGMIGAKFGTGYTPATTPGYSGMADQDIGTGSGMQQGGGNKDPLDLSSFIKSGNYQGAYDHGVQLGYTPEQIARYTNTNYGTKWSGDDLIKSFEQPKAAASMNSTGMAGLINSGKFLDAYTAGRKAGLNPDQIARQVNATYGTSWSGNDLVNDYEQASQKALAGQGYGYTTYAGGNGRVGGGQTGIYGVGLLGSGSPQAASQLGGQARLPAGTVVPDRPWDPNGPNFGGNQPAPGSSSGKTVGGAGSGNTGAGTGGAGSGQGSSTSLNAGGSQHSSGAFVQGVDYNTATVEGRVANLLDQNSRVIQQAGNRARAAFAQRGLLNSSMAEEAAMEAMTTKAIEIAGPDAAAYLKQSQLNQDWINKFGLGDREQGYKMETMDKQATIDINKIAAEYGFRNTAEDKTKIATLQTNYISAVEAANNNYSTMVNAANQADATPEEKQAMIVNAQNARTSALSLINATFSRMPNWSKDWLIGETPTTQVSNPGTPVNESFATTDIDYSRIPDFGSRVTDFGSRVTVGRGITTMDANKRLQTEYAAYKTAGGGLAPLDWFSSQYPVKAQTVEQM